MNPFWSLAQGKRQNEFVLPQAKHLKPSLGNLSQTQLGIDRIATSSEIVGPKLDSIVVTQKVAASPSASRDTSMKQPLAPKELNQSQSAPTSADGLRKPISELPLRFRPIFSPYTCFNHVQSLVFDSVMQTHDPIVVSAPTGSGKTGVFELAIIKMIMTMEAQGCNLGAAKVIYLAPTKALCTERRIDWEKKFAEFNLECIELTSDINHAVNFKSLQKSCILLATPEKWDSVTRTWNVNKSFVKTIRLLLVDEIHLVNDGHRGATLEAVISRMKIIRSIIWPSEPDKLRFLAVSATASNVDDIADWFTTPQSKAKVFQVDPRERPVKLRTIVLGYTISQSANEFQFDNLLNHKLADVIKQHSNEKPTLIFCNTRKSAVTAAQVLAKEGKFDRSYSNDRRRAYLALSSQIRDKNLQDTTRLGIAFHHAGLSLTDRRSIESNFVAGKLFILCCTSTLAMGVNLPAHLVIIKNTVYYDEGKFQPYTESSLVQMMGRAGRPQYDTEATAVIMTKTSHRDEIEKVLTGNLQIDSHLHKFLTEHLNSEIVLGTITDDSIARKWIDSTFLHVRIMKNPENYGLKKNCSPTDIETTIINCVSNSIKLLLQHGMAQRNKQGNLEPTDVGRAMAKHYLCLDTMVKLLNMKRNESLWDLIRVVSMTQEVQGDVQMRAEDRAAISNLINATDENLKIRYSLGDKVDTREKKAALLIEATLGNLPIPELAMFQESLRVMKNATRVINCMRDVYFISVESNYTILKNILVLSQCFAARLWNDSVYVSKQIERIGGILSKNLAQNGLTTFKALRDANPRNIEIFCGRLPPFGSKIQQTCHALPVYIIKITFHAVPNQPSRVQLLIEVSIENGQDLRSSITIPNHTCTLIIGVVKTDKLIMKQRLSDQTILNSSDLTVCYGVELDRSEFSSEGCQVEASLISDLFVGLDARQTVVYVGPNPI